MLVRMSAICKASADDRRSDVIGDLDGYKEMDSFKLSLYSYF